MSTRMFLGGNARKHGGTFTRFVNPPKHEPSDRESAALLATHPAVVNGTTLFPTRVFDAHGRDNILIPGVNNAKLGSHVTRGAWAGMPIFSFALEERATCPRSCGNWDTCYGNALPMAVRFRYSPALMEALETDLKRRLSFNPKGIVVRLHTLGDFPGVDYLARWEGWMRNMPRLHVWGYTAHAPATELGQRVGWLNELFPGRWVFRYSVPPTALPGPLQATTTWDKPERHNHAAGGTICPAETGQVPACGKCGICWDPAHADRRITFLGHGMSKLGRKPGQTGKPQELGPPSPPKKRGRPRKIQPTETLNLDEDMTLHEEILLAHRAIVAEHEVIRAANARIVELKAQIELLKKRSPREVVFKTDPVAAEFSPTRRGRLAIKDQHGAPSVAASMQRHMDADLGAVPMDLEGAFAWGKANHLPLAGNARDDWHLVNRQRVRFQLPPFKLIIPVGRPEPLVSPHVGGRD